MTNQKINPVDIVKSIEDFSQAHEVTGTIAVSLEGSLIYKKGVGVSDHSLKSTCDLHTMYHIASITKQFTAAALLKVLYDREPSEQALKASLKRPVSHYLKSNDPLWESDVPSWANNVTLHHLLTHTSGICNYTDCDAFWKLYKKKEPSLSNLVALFKNEPLLFKAGLHYNYCNTGYFLIGQVIERLCDKSFSEYLNEVFFKPLKMYDTFLPISGTVPILKEKYPHIARGYEFNLLHPYGPYREIKKYWPHSIDQGDGGIISTASDLLKWNNALYKGHVLPRGIVDVMLREYVQMEDSSGECKLFYGYGLVIKNDPCIIYSHSGHIPGYKAYLGHVPSLDLSIVSLSNLTFDFSCNQNERDIIKSEISHIQNEDEKQKRYNQLFEERYPEVIEIMKKHSLLQADEVLSQQRCIGRGKS